MKGTYFLQKMDQYDSDFFTQMDDAIFEDNLASYSPPLEGDFETPADQSWVETVLVDATPAPAAPPVANNAIISAGPGNTSSRCSPRPSSFIDDEAGVSGKGKGKGKNRCNPSIFWCGTYFPEGQPTDDEMLMIGTQMFDQIKHRCVKIAMQCEMCPETNRKHFQFCIQATGRIRPLSLKLSTRVHWEKCQGTWAENLKYCTKKETRHLSKMWLKGCLAPEEIKLISKDDFRDWQKELLDILEAPPSDRSVYWYWSQIGGVGKTCFGKYVAVTLPGTMVANGKGGDILAQLVAYAKENGYYPRIVIMNLPKAVGNMVSYASIEQIKDGLCMSGKYEGGQIIMNPPHIVVFANLPPDYEKMSDDRFIVRNIGN